MLSKLFLKNDFAEQNFTVMVGVKNMPTVSTCRGVKILPKRGYPFAISVSTFFYSCSNWTCVCFFDSHANYTYMYFLDSYANQIYVYLFIFCTNWIDVCMPFDSHEMNIYLHMYCLSKQHNSALNDLGKVDIL